MTVLFYLSAAVAVLATVLVITRTNAVHALLYLIVSLLAAALCIYTLGAPFAAALEVILYAGAIMVLFIFVIMMLDLGPGAEQRERSWLEPRAWAGPALLCAILLTELILFLAGPGAGAGAAQAASPKDVGMALFGPYVLGVELASMLMLAALVGAYHLGRTELDRSGTDRDW